MTRSITPATSLDNLRKEAKRWLKTLRDGDADARRPLERVSPGAPASRCLRDVQHALAREHGYESWIALQAAGAGAGRRRPTGPADGRRVRAVADDLVAFNDAHDEAALERAERALRPVVHVRRSVGGDLAPRLLVPPALVAWCRRTSAPGRSTAARRAGRRLRQLGGAQPVAAADGQRPMPASPSTSTDSTNRAAPPAERDDEWDEVIA